MAPTGDPMDRDELHYAALENDTIQLATLLGSGSDPDVRDRADWTPLHFAAQDNSFDAAKALLQGGAAVDARNEHGNAPLWVAIMKGARRGEAYVPMIQLLIDAGADIHAPNTGTGTGTGIITMVANVAWSNPHIMEVFAGHLPTR